MPPRLVGPAQFVGHQDITPENVVFRGGRAAALIDFDLAGLTDRPGEVANVLLWWAPLMPRQDREPVLREVNAHRRAALIVDAYGLSADDRARVIATARNYADRAWYSMRDRAERLGGGWRRMWEEGVGERILRRQAWLAENAASLEAAVVGAA